MIKGKMRSLILYVTFYSYSIASQNCFWKDLSIQKPTSFKHLKNFTLLPMIYDYIYWPLKRAVPAPSLSDNQKKWMQKVLSTSCVVVPMEKKNQAHKSQEGT